jgi:molybdopterin-guanine dinucleotide biosynthesis protein A
MNGDGIVAVLAGGRSSRMGRPKALSDLNGRPLIAHALAAVAEAGLEAAVVAKPDSELPALDARVIREPAEPLHPLLGVATALEEAGSVVSLPCDMPFVPGPMLAWLWRQPERLVVCEGGGRLHPLLGRFAAELAPELRAAVEAGTSAQEAVRGLDARVASEAELSNFGPPRRVLFNVNDPEDLAEAEGLT